MLQKTVKRLLVGASIMSACFILYSPMVKADFPERTINYILPFNPGGESDVSARLQEPFFTQYGGEGIAIQYKAGAGGAAGWAQLNSLNPDGYTIMGVNLPHIILQPMDKDVGYKTDDLDVFYWFHFTPDALLVPASSPHQNLSDFIEAAKKAPGATIIGGTGTRSGNELAKVRFDKMNDITTSYIPFRGTGAVNTALLGNQIQAAWGYTTGQLQLGNQIRCLGVASEERHPHVPDCPTFKEQGINLVGGVYRGLAVPQKTPIEVKNKLANIVHSINKDPKFIESMESNGFVMIDIGPEEMADFMNEQKEIFQDAAQDLGIKQN